MRFTDTAWKKLSATVLNLVEQDKYWDEVARILAHLAQVFLNGSLAHRYFQVWEEHGFHLTPVYFYQPIPDARTLLPIGKLVGKINLT